MGEEVEPGRHRCPVCPNKGFDSVGDKKRHIRDNHPDSGRKKK